MYSFSVPVLRDEIVRTRRVTKLDFDIQNEIRAVVIDRDRLEMLFNSESIPHELKDKSIWYLSNKSILQNYTY